MKGSQRNLTGPAESRTNRAQCVGRPQPSQPALELLEYLEYSIISSAFNNQEIKDHGTKSQGIKSQGPRLGGYTVLLVSLFKGKIDLING